jgi:hypothetical protein
MCLHLKICRNVCGTWSVHGLLPLPVSDLRSLSESIDYAREKCAAAPATIVLLIDGFYLVVHQERGWPRRLLVSEAEQAHPVPAEADPDDLLF